MSVSIKQPESTPKIIYVIADQSTDITYLYQKFGIVPTEQQATSLRLQILNLSPKIQTYELYIFPRNREIKPYCELYHSILAKPDLIIYAVDIQSSINQCIEWLNLFEKDHGTRIAFFSSACTYLERQQILTKINTLFLRSANNQVFFPYIDNSSFQSCFYNVNKVGMSMQGYTRMIPAFSKLKWLWRRIINWRKTSDAESVV